MSKVMGVAIVCFAVTMAIVVGSRISPESMSIVVGVICGVAVSVPMSALALALAGRRREETEAMSSAGGWQTGSYPPIVVLQGPQQVRGIYPSLPSSGRGERAIFQEGYPLQEQPSWPFQHETRSFRVVGESSSDYEVDQDAQQPQPVWSRW